jgi:hypothetical protein
MDVRIACLARGSSSFLTFKTSRDRCFQVKGAESLGARTGTSEFVYEYNGSISAPRGPAPGTAIGTDRRIFLRATRVGIALCKSIAQNPLPRRLRRTRLPDVGAVYESDRSTRSARRSLPVAGSHRHCTHKPLKEFVLRPQYVLQPSFVTCHGLDSSPLEKLIPVGMHGRISF